MILSLLIVAPAALADHPDGGVTDDPAESEHDHNPLEGYNLDRSAPLIAHDAATADIVSSGPSAKVIKNLAAASRGVRNVADATTDVWAHNGYAYTGTFNSPCGGDPEAGVWIWDVHNNNKAEFVGIIPSPAGSRSNDVKVAAMNSGDVLVHSNESCGGGPGGFEIWNVDDPTNPVHLASVGPINELNPISDALFGGITDVGVHNLWLFTDGDRDYVAAVVESAFDTFRIYDITDPTNPTMVSAWGAEEVFDPGVGDESSDVNRVLNAALWLTSGFGASQNRFLHDVTISADGNHAYLSNWDAGLILLEVSDPANPQYVSTALDLSADGDMEVNSHAAWPSENGGIVVETNEDFSPFTTVFNITSGPDAGQYEAFEFSFTTPIASLPGQEMSGPTTYVGLACNDSDPVPAGSNIALVLRGSCRFDEKATNVINAGYTGMVVFTASPDDAPFSGGGNARAIPGVMVGHETGLSIAGVSDAAELVLGASGESVAAATAPDGWGQVRIWDYSDPANPVLASSVDTVCSATVVDPSCDPNGTYSVHNVIVETTGNKTKAYISWYWDGMLILDVTDPYNPVETARFLDNSTNDGLANDFWGIYKVPNSPWIYGSDRNGGLYVFKEYGSGSVNRASKEVSSSAQASAAGLGGRGPAFVHGIVIPVDGVDYWLAGPPDGPDGARDVPGHDWVQAGPTQLVGKHYNTGPFGAPSWWSSDSPDGELLYMVHGVIDTWTPENAEQFAARGYVHYHELVSVADGSLHPTKVVWFRHHARTSFTLDGGPRPDLAHAVTPGVDFEFINNYFVPYDPDGE